MAVDELAQVLLMWGRDHWADRALPWRRPNEPRGRRALVEGLLAQTRADAVAAAYEGIFQGVSTGDEWLALSVSQRQGRVAPLGLPLLKRRAVDGIARATGLDPLGPEQRLALLEAQPGVGPYTAGMVALLLGIPSAPVDCNVERVAGRVDPSVAPAAWIGEVLDAAMGLPSPLPEFHAGYVAISAVLDIGATRCEIGRAPRCAGCPLERWALYEGCEYAARGPRQLEMWR